MKVLLMLSDSRYDGKWMSFLLLFLLNSPTTKLHWQMLQKLGITDCRVIATLPYEHLGWKMATDMYMYMKGIMKDTTHVRHKIQKLKSHVRNKAMRVGGQYMTKETHHEKLSWRNCTLHELAVWSPWPNVEKIMATFAANPRFSGPEQHVTKNMSPRAT